MAKDEQTESKDWQLEESSDVDDRWVLQDSEQQLNDQWDIEGTDEPVSQWQPVEYEKQSRGRLTWILPTIVTVALLGVLGYSVYELFPVAWDAVEKAIGIGTPLDETPTPQAVAEADANANATLTAESAVAPPVEATPTPVEEPTEEPPTPTPSPTPPVVEQRFATVISAYGVNARREPNTNAEIIRILEQNETVFVYGEQEVEGDVWLTLLVADGPLVEGQPVTGVVGYAAADYFAQGVQPISRELYDQALAAGGMTPTPEAVEPTATAEEEAAVEQPTEGVVLPTVTPSQGGASPSTTITITVDAVAGVNVRTLPDLTSPVVALLPDQTVVPAISRLATNDWLLLDLGDGARGWVSADLVIANGDVNSLSVTTAGDLPQPPAAPTETPTPEAAAIAEPVEPPAPYVSQLPAGVPGASVFSAEGVNARQAPNTESTVTAILPQNAALPVAGRSADGEWLLVEMPWGGTAWVFRSAIIPIGDVNGVPVSNEAGTAAPQPAAEATPAEAETAPAVTAEPAATPDATAKPVEATATIRSIVAPIYGGPSAEGESIERVGKGTALPATGRTADGQWIQVKSASGATGWMEAAAVDLSVAVETLAIIE